MSEKDTNMSELTKIYIMYQLIHHPGCLAGNINHVLIR